MTNEELVAWAENIGIASPRIGGYELVRNLNDLAAYTRKLEKALADGMTLITLLVDEIEK